MFEAILQKYQTNEEVPTESAFEVRNKFKQFVKSVVPAPLPIGFHSSDPHVTSWYAELQYREIWTRI